MENIIKFPRPLRRAIPAPPASSQHTQAPPSKSDSFGWLEILIFGVMGAVLGAVLIPVMAVVALLRPVVRFFFSVYMVGILIAMLFGGSKWLLIGMAHFGVLGALMLMLGMRMSK